jgi:hypothetical protein
MRKPLAALAALLLTAWVTHADGQQTTVQDQGARIKQLQKEWLAAVRAMAKQDAMRAKDGQAPPDELLASTRLLAEAELAACESDKERAVALEKVLVTARDTERLAEALAKSGQGRESTALKAKAERLRFEIALERAKTKAAAKPVEGNANPGLDRGQLVLVEKQAAIRQAAVKVAEAQRAKAQARLATVKAQVAQAKAAESHAEMQFQRFNDLYKTNAVEERVLDEQRAKLEGARASRVAAEGQVAEAESQVAIEQARMAQAQLEFEEAQLKLEQLKAQLRSR